jgi:predicted phage terminase large subunit-like protein
VAFPTQHPTAEQFKKQRAEFSFYQFVKQAWHCVEPSPFIDGWHVQAVCDHLQAVFEGKIRNLVINIPPRCSKSLITSVLFPAWIWIKKPETRFLLLSYALKLSIRDNVKCRDLIRTPWYQDRWGEIVKLKGDQDMKERYETISGGFRQVTSIGSSATGEGGEFVICDDANATDESDDVRRNTLEWWDSTMPTRLNDPKKGSFIVIQQRTAENDLTGHLLQKGGYELLRLPMEYEDDKKVTAIGFSDPRTEPGELLCLHRFGPDEVGFLKRELGTFKAAGQLQQRPTSKEGGILNPSWFGQWKPTTLPETFDEMLTSWDFSFKGEKGANGSDFVVGQVWGRRKQEYFLLDQVRAQADFVKTLEMFTRLCDKWPRVNSHIVEEKANGAAIVASLRQRIAGIIPVSPKDSKEARVSAVSPLIESGNVYIPEVAQWKEEFLFEMSLFPKGKNDDMVDSMSQALLRFEKTRKREMRFVLHEII